MEPDLREKALKLCAVDALSLDGLAGWAILHSATHLTFQTVALSREGWEEEFVIFVRRLPGMGQRC